jgi:hypothetical protein
MWTDDLWVSDWAIVVECHFQLYHGNNKSLFDDDWLTDWLIVCCLTSSGKYFMHIQDENEFNNIKN